MLNYFAHFEGNSQQSSNQQSSNQQMTADSTGSTSTVNGSPRQTSLGERVGAAIAQMADAMGITGPLASMLPFALGTLLQQPEDELRARISAVVAALSHALEEPTDPAAGTTDGDSQGA